VALTHSSLYLGTNSQWCVQLIEIIKLLIIGITERIVWKERNLIVHHGVQRSMATRFCKVASNVCGRLEF